MNLTQFLIFEICEECHRGHEHTWCPNRHPERFARSTGRRPLSDDQIVAIVRDAYGRHGFRGLVGWHYYNEPLCAWWRLRPLLARLQREVPGFQAVLWTNGDQLPTDLAELRAFAQVHVTNYAGRSFAALISAVPNVRVCQPTPDRRLAGPGPDSDRPCRRPFVEMIVDAFGNLHPCCYDWRGCVALGNVHDTPFAQLVERWQAFRATVAGERMTDAAPPACRSCSMRGVKIPDFVPAVAEAARTGRSPAQGTPYLVAVAYRIPEHRVRDFCTWNEPVFTAAGARVVLVVETPYAGLPAWVTQVAFTEPMPVFSIARTKNHGIRAALTAGAPVVIASDIDMVFPPETLQRLCCCRPGTASVPLYRMASDYPNRDRQFVDAPQATGTVGMPREQWQAVQYDERCVGYGCDDGILLRACQRAGFGIVDRAAVVYHIAHQPGTCQREFRGRSDHWGRAEGFNPENFRGNRRLVGDACHLVAGR